MGGPQTPFADGSQAWQLRPALTRRSVATVPGSAATGGLSWRRPGQAGSGARAGRAQLPPRPRGRGAVPAPGRAAAPLGQVLKLAEQLEERLFRSYDSYNKLIEERLQELSEVLERVEGVQAELRCICCTIEAAYQDLCLQPEV